MKFFAIIFAVFFFSAFPQGPALSQEQQREDPGKFMERVFREGSELINKELTSEGRRKVVRRIVLKFFDVPGLGVRVLGEMGERLLPEQRREFEIRFQKYFCSSSKALDELEKSSEIRYKDFPRQRSEGLASSIKIRGKQYLSNYKEPFDVYYNMLWKGGGWQVINASFEGGNIEDEYKKEFNDLITADFASSYQSVIKYLDCRLNGMDKASCKKREVYSSTRGGDN